MDYKDLRTLAKIALKNDRSNPVAYSCGNEKFTLEQVNEALVKEFNRLAPDYRTFEENKNTIYRLIEETITDVLPARIDDLYMQFAEVRRVPQGDKAIFRQRISEMARERAKTFVTRVGLAGRYETFILDGREIEVGTAAIGGAVRIGFEEVLDGRLQFAELTAIIMEGMNEYIYKEIAKAFVAMAKNVPEVQQATEAGFDEATMDQLLAISDAYGKTAIYCTQEFAATMKPAEGWASSNIKDALWMDGYLGFYKGHDVIILPQSMKDVTNKEKVVDPSYAFLIPAGPDSKPVKLVFEGQTCVRDVEDNDDWSRDMQTYQKFGIATLASNWMCVYQNTDLKIETRPE